MSDQRGPRPLVSAFRTDDAECLLCEVIRRTTEGLVEAGCHEAVTDAVLMAGLVAGTHLQESGRVPCCSRHFALWTLAVDELDAGALPSPRLRVVPGGGRDG